MTVTTERRLCLAACVAAWVAIWFAAGWAFADEPPPLAPVEAPMPAPRPDLTARRMADADARLIEATTMPPAAPEPSVYVCPDSLVVVGDWCLAPEETRTAEIGGTE